jgi:hypothetical protein
MQEIYNIYKYLIIGSTTLFGLGLPLISRQIIFWVGLSILNQPPAILEV